MIANIIKIIYQFLLTIVCFSGIQWGLVGVGGFLNKNLNVVSILSKGNITIEYITYCIVGVATILFIWLSAIDTQD